jgi:3-deoxy-7-phosphoheptulonate synthase
MKDISDQDRLNNLPLVCAPGERRRIDVGGKVLGGREVMVIAGPCTVESRGSMLEIAHAAAEAGADGLRGGVFKPLTFPYGDPLAQPDRDDPTPGRGRMDVLPLAELLPTAERRLAYMKEAGEQYGLPVVTEVLYASTVPMMEDYVDMWQVGYRHMFNMDLVEALAASSRPILLKRHYGESLRSLLGVAEHLAARGHRDVAVCERGITSNHTHRVTSRSIMDIQAIPALNEFAPTVPVVADPSKATFHRDYVPQMTLAAVAAGADGILVEIHDRPEDAWVDPLNSLSFDRFGALMKDVRALQDIVRPS